MFRSTVAIAEDRPGWWRRAVVPARLHAPLILGILALVLAANYAVGPTFAFGGLYAVTVCTSAWLLGLAPALVLGCTIVAASTAINGVGGPYGGAALEENLALGVGLRCVSLFAAVALIARVRGHYEIARMQADRDPLTGLHNHRAFRESLEASLARTARGAQAIALACVDLDDFKHINDRLGHLAGDRALRAFADAARTAVRLGDCVARLGGDEFAIVIEARDAAEAEAAAARVHARIVACLAVEELALSFSMGAVIADAPAGRDMAELIHAADGLMYRSKRAGKGTLTVAPLDAPAEGARLAA